MLNITIKIVFLFILIKAKSLISILGLKPCLSPRIAKLVKELNKLSNESTHVYVVFTDVEFAVSIIGGADVPTAIYILTKPYINNHGGNL